MKWTKEEEVFLAKLMEKHTSPTRIYEEFVKVSPARSFWAVKAKIMSMQLSPKNLWQGQCDEQTEAKIEKEEEVIIPPP